MEAPDLIELPEEPSTWGLIKDLTKSLWALLDSLWMLFGIAVCPILVLWNSWKHFGWPGFDMALWGIVFAMAYAETVSLRHITAKDRKSSSASTDV
jgi:hypothetical protein